MISGRKELSRVLFHAGAKIARIDVPGKYRWLQATASWSAAQREQWRLERLGDILEFAWQIPFYREFWGDHGVKPSRPRELSELANYPILTKQHLREHGGRIHGPQLKDIRHISKCTGGSTSVPVQYFLDVDLWAFMEAFHLHSWMQFGYELGDPVGVIAGGSLVPKRVSVKSRLRGFVQRRLFLWGVAMNAELARAYHRQLTAYGAQYLYGYPSVLWLFAKHLRELGLEIPGIKAVVTTAEMLLPHYRQGLEEVLGCRVFNNYGSNDGGTESYECTLHAGLHYNDLQSVLETSPGESTGGVGRLLITNLWNRSTPFIRYENGDLVELGTHPCPCGSPFPLIRSVQGRTADILTFASGKSLSGPALTLMFGDMKIDGWQAVQTGANRLEVRLLTSGALDPAYPARIREILDFHLRGAVTIDVRRVDHLQLTAGGKLKPVIIEGTN